MANEDQVKILKQGVVTWNQWRNQNLTTTIDLIKADLSGLDLTKANLERADLAGAILRGANLRNAHLQGAMLGGADFSEADIPDTNFKGAFLNEADLSSARGLTQRQINSANTVDYAKLPGSIKGRHKTAKQRS